MSAEASPVVRAVVLASACALAAGVFVAEVTWHLAKRLGGSR